MKKLILAILLCPMIGMAQGLPSGRAGTCTSGQYLQWSGGAGGKWVCVAGSGGMSITVNGSALADPIADFDDATPAASAGYMNVSWQKDALSPTNVSAQVPVFGTAPGSNLVTTSLGGDPTANNCVKWVAGGKLDDSGSACGGGSGANTTLSNLTDTIAINKALIPSSAAALDFGSATVPWKDIFLAGSSGTPGTNNFKFTGASTSGTRTVTLIDSDSRTLALGGDDTVPVSNGSSFENKTLPDCTDTGGNHLNYTQSSNAFSCGTSSGGATASVPVTRRWATIAPAGSGSDITLSNVGDYRPGTAGTVALVDPTANDPYPHQTYTTTTSNGNFAGLRSGTIWRTGKELYGFAVFSIAGTSTIRFWAALTDQTGGTMGASDDPAGNYVGIRFSTSAGDTKFQCISKDNTTQNIATNPLVNGDTNRHTVEIIADDGAPNYIIKIDGTQACDTLTSNLPTTGTNLAFVMGVTCLSCSPTAQVLRFGRWYGEADY